jgi:hypothetical protein
MNAPSALTMKHIHTLVLIAFLTLSSHAFGLGLQM